MSLKRESLDDYIDELVDKRNENWDKVDAHLTDNATEHGDLTTLQTAQKGSLVGAINELNTGKANKQQEAWITPTLLNGWFSDVPIVQYRKYNDGLVQLRGIAKAGVAGSVLFTLPVGYRPNGQHNFIGYTSSGQALVIIYSDGRVVINNYTNWVYLNQISFGI